MTNRVIIEDEETESYLYVGILHGIISILFILFSFYSLLKGMSNFNSLKEIYTSYSNIIFDQNTIKQILYTVMFFYVHVVLFLAFLYTGIVGLKDLIIQR